MSKPTITFKNGRWAVGNYSTSAPNKLINHLVKQYRVTISIEDVLAMTAETPKETAVSTAPPQDDADIKES